MLVLTRKTNQQIQIGEDITLTVIEVKGRYVRLGIEAPRAVRIVRVEIDGQEHPCDHCPHYRAECVEAGKVPPCERPGGKEQV